MDSTTAVKPGAGGTQASSQGAHLASSPAAVAAEAAGLVIMPLGVVTLADR